MLMFTNLILQVMAAKAPTSGLNVCVFGESKEATYVDVPLVPKLEFPELLFPPTFTGVSVFLTCFP